MLLALPYCPAFNCCQFLDIRMYFIIKYSETYLLVFRNERVFNKSERVPSVSGGKEVINLVAVIITKLRMFNVEESRVQQEGKMQCGSFSTSFPDTWRINTRTLWIIALTSSFSLWEYLPNRLVERSWRWEGKRG